MLQTEAILSQSKTKLCHAQTQQVRLTVEGLEVGDCVITVLDRSNLYGSQSDWHHGHGDPMDGIHLSPQELSCQGSKACEFELSPNAALVCAGSTAWNALYGNLPLNPSQTVLFQGEPITSL